MVSKLTKYDLRMMKLSGRIFGEYKRPPMPPEISREKMVDNRQRNAWESFHYQNERVIQKTAEKPPDLDVMRLPEYYPPHKQFKHLMRTLRGYGLYRDEHSDIVEELKRLRIVRGKEEPEKRSRKGKKEEKEKE